MGRALADGPDTVGEEMRAGTHMRRTDGCLNCGEEREIAAHGLCFTCYRQAERAGDRQRTRMDRHNAGVRRDHKKLIRAFAAVIAGLGDLGASRDDVLMVRRMLEPYIAPIAYFLEPAPKEQKPTRSEQ